jgi:excisionase family DNA binding protein
VTEPWSTLLEVAEHLQVAEETVHRWIRRKGMPGQRLGRNWRFKLSEVDAWVRAGGANNPSDDSDSDIQPAIPEKKTP